MIKVKILLIGKTKEKWLTDAVAEYEKRLRGILSLEWIYAKSDEELVALAKKEPSFIGLDPQGDLLTSEEFAVYLERNWEKNGGRLTFIIGGADGLPPFIKKHSALISLSRLTFTHQMTRLVLIEQIYRAERILKGSPYHK